MTNKRKKIVDLPSEEVPLFFFVLLAKAVRMLLVPVPSAGDDVVDIFVLRTPAQHLPGLA